MELHYQYSESTKKPDVIQIDGDTVFLRKNISAVTREDEHGNKTAYWTYQEARLTQAEFNAYASLTMSQNAIKGAEDSEKIAALMAGQEFNTEYSLILMDAMADLYDALAMLM